MNINGASKIYGIIGWPVQHSLSPAFQCRFIQNKDINAVYVPFAVAPELLVTAMHGLQALGVAGFNVTVPHKESLFELVEADADAKKIGAVNTVRRSADGWQASNTDWRGFKAVVEGLAVDVSGKQALLFGAGGTARAVLHALAVLKLDKVIICNRNPDRLDSFIDWARESYPALHIEPLAWQQSDVSLACQQSALLINSTSIGLKPDQAFPFVLSGDGMAMDAVYRPDGKTAFVEAASQAGRLAVDGLPMLIAQGAIAFGWWHDCDTPDFSQALQQMQLDLGRREMLLPGWSSN
ncbi:MAG: shikimate dehydrogenase [Mariprofundus sp.]|nr:shikimate dehydrogenase [Mariprofundus sp.]